MCNNNGKECKAKRLTKDGELPLHLRPPRKVISDEEERQVVTELLQHLKDTGHLDKRWAGKSIDEVTSQILGEIRRDRKSAGLEG
jgi:hypothetical protein